MRRRTPSFWNKFSFAWIFHCPFFVYNCLNRQKNRLLRFDCVTSTPTFKMGFITFPYNFMFIIFKKFILCKYFTIEKFYILNALLISLLQLKLIKTLFYKISLFSYILTPEITYNCCPARVTTMVVDIMAPSLCLIRSHKKKIESSPSMIFPQGIETLRYYESAAICTHNL